MRLQHRGAERRMKQCLRCGKKNPIDSTTCVKCGCILKKEAILKVDVPKPSLGQVPRGI